MLLCLIGNKEKVPIMPPPPREEVQRKCFCWYHGPSAVTSLFTFMQLFFTWSPRSSSSVEFIVRVSGMGGCPPPLL